MSIWRTCVLALFVLPVLARAEASHGWAGGDAQCNRTNCFARSSNPNSTFGPIVSKIGIVRAKTNSTTRAGLAVLVAAITPEPFCSLEFHRGIRHFTASMDPSRVYAPRAPPVLFLQKIN